jgi:putative transposase
MRGGRSTGGKGNHEEGHPQGLPLQGDVYGEKMRYDPDKHHRRSIRLRNYDYAWPGMYFITICTQNRDLLFGNIVNDIMQLNAAGQMVQAIWETLPERFPNIGVDEFVVMPNHFHAILVIEECRPAGEDGIATGDVPTLGAMIGAFKSITTHEYIQGVKCKGWPPFDRRVWQRNYWEHVVRDEATLDKIRQYVRTNPAFWTDDQLHPDALPNKYNA